MGDQYDVKQCSRIEMIPGVTPFCIRQHCQAAQVTMLAYLLMDRKHTIALPPATPTASLFQTHRDYTMPIMMLRV